MADDAKLVPPLWLKMPLEFWPMFSDWAAKYPLPLRLYVPVQPGKMPE